MSDIVYFPGVASKPEFTAVNENLVGILERLLADAKTGKLQCIVGCGVLYNDDFVKFRVLTAGVNYFKIRGILDWLKEDFVQSCDGAPR